MNKICTLLVALVVAGASVPAASVAAFADPAPADPQKRLAELNQQLSGDQVKLNDLNDRVERAEADVDTLNRKVADDERREVELRERLTRLARIEYQQPALSLSTILGAQSLDQLLGAIAQARLVAHRQRRLVSEVDSLRRDDEQARDQEAGRLAEIERARQQALQIVARTLALRDSAQDEVARARASAIAAQAQANAAHPAAPPPPAVAPPAPKPQSRVVQAIPPAPRPTPARTAQPAAPRAAPVPPTAGAVAFQPPSGNHFAYGYCTWYVANKRSIPWYGNAIQWWPNAAIYGYAEGQIPRVGAVMVTRESVVYGHVAYVESVHGDGSWTVSEMNYTAWNVVDMRTIRPGQVPLVGFIYGKTG
jgi:peptidoglycan DL-endopeptidase CwlO